MTGARSRARGFTLIELMIAITLSLLIVGAVISLYVTSQHLYRVQNNLSRLQESARYAMNEMSRDLRMAGYEGCLTGHITPHNDLNNTTSYPYNFSTPLQGYQFVSGAWLPALDPAFTATLTPASPPGGVFTLDTTSDIITVRLADPAQMLAVTQPSASASTLNVSLPNPFYSGQILLVTNCTGADIFQVTAQPNGSAVTHNSGTSVYPGNVQAALSQNYGSDAQVMPMSTVTYFVATYQAPGSPAPPPGPPTLWRVDTTNIPPGSTQPLPLAVATNVKQMTLYYGEDTDGDGSANEYLTAQQIQSVDPAMTHVVSVRVVLLFQTGDDYLSRVPQTIQNYPIPGAPAPGMFTATDRRLYRVFTITVALRNRAL
ncbi:MAG: PilW family protein [Acidiferrobacteraceae bacterium]